MVALMVAITIIGFVVLDLVLQAVRKQRGTAQRPVELEFSDFRVPMATFFYPGHTWVNILPGGDVHVGLDDFTRKVIGGIEHIELPERGRTLKQGERAFTVTTGGKKLAFLSPVDGEVVGINRMMLSNPAEVSKNPYGSGWMLDIRPTNLSANLRIMKIAEDAIDWLRAELKRFREFALGENLHHVKDELQYEVGRTSQDGGFLTEGMLGRMDEKSVKYFEEEFLSKTE